MQTTQELIDIMFEYWFYADGIHIKTYDTLAQCLRLARQWQCSFANARCKIEEHELIYLLGEHRMVSEPTGKTISLIRPGVQSVEVVEDLGWTDDDMAEEVSDEDLIFDDMSEQDILGQL